MPLLIARAGLADDTAQICAAAAATPVPAADQATAPQGCSAYRAYYGIGQPADPALARACAFRERQEDGQDAGEPFRGAAILAMIYANGQGVPANPALAVRFACEIKDAAAAETEARVAHLREPVNGRRFDLCDDITGGYMAASCESKESDLAEQERRRRTAGLLAGATASQQAAFDTLGKAAETYFTLDADSTLGTGGTLRPALELAATERQRTLFADTLTRLEQRERPAETADDFAAADRDLNEIYRTLLDRARPDDGITPDGLRKAERAWIAYRDRWLEFARLRYPELPPEALKTLLTRQRIAAIDTVLHPPR